MWTGIICGLAAIWSAVFIARRSAPQLKTPLYVFLLTYVVTSAIGATLLAVPTVRDLWMVTYPQMDTAWISPGESWGYWFLVWGPLPVSTLAAALLFDRMRAPAVVAARLLGRNVDLLPAVLIGALLCAYCFVNLAQWGYLGVNLLSGEYIGRYRENIQLRAQMFGVLGTVHFACIYMGIPAIAILAFCNAVRRRAAGWWLLFAALSAALILLYAATLTKANILIYGLAIVVTAQMLGLIRLRGILVAVAGGTAVLMGLTALLAGTDPLDVAITGYNILFREASDVPFYLAVFPEQVPYVGIDLGLGEFEIGPTVSSNLVVSNFMWPHETWVQGAAPAAAQVMAYAQGGYPWAFVTMILVGAWIAVSGQLKRVSRNPVVLSAFIGSVMTCYYLSQSDFVGAFNVGYGYKWWIAALLLVLGLQWFMQRALRQPRPAAA